MPALCGASMLLLPEQENVDGRAKRGHDELCCGEERREASRRRPSLQRVHEQRAAFHCVNAKEAHDLRPGARVVRGAAVIDRRNELTADLLRIAIDRNAAALDHEPAKRGIAALEFDCGMALASDEGV